MRSAVAKGGLGLVVGGHICVEHLKTVVAESVLTVAPLRARTWGERGRVQEEVHTTVAPKVGDKDLLHIWKQHRRVARVAREARVGSILLYQSSANVVVANGTDIFPFLFLFLFLSQHPSIVALFIKSRTRCTRSNTSIVVEASVVAGTWLF